MTPNKQTCMKHFLLLLLFAGTTVALHAQATYTEALRKAEPGKGTVTIEQSEAIEQLVNNTAPRPVAPAKPHGSEPVRNQSATDAHRTEAPEKHTAKREHSATNENKSRSGKTYVTRTRHKARGYRICIFTGGNSRADKNKALQMGKKCREKFSELSAYTSFVSPRWVTYVGDFRTRQEAQKYVNLIRKARFTYEVRIVASEVNLPD